MGIKRGAYERVQRGNISAPQPVHANVPAINAGAGIAAMSGAMREKARAEKEKWNLKPIFDALQRVWMAYDNVKDAQYERMVNSAAKITEYEKRVNAGLEQFNPDTYLQMKRRTESLKATYDNFGISFIAEGPTDKADAAKDFMENRASRDVRESFSRRFRIEEDAKKAAEMALAKQDYDYSGVED
jgi:hypothetical protein